MTAEARRRPGRAAPRAATAVACLVLAAGCTGAAEEPVPEFTPVPSSIVPGAAANPLDAVRYPDVVPQRAIQVAIQSGVERCVADRGFDHPVPLMFEYATPAGASSVFGTVDPESAAVNGLKSAQWVEDFLNRDPDRDQEPFPEGFVDALFGDTQAVVFHDDDGVVFASYDPESCAGLVKDEVTPDWVEQGRLTEIAGQILLDAHVALDADQRVIDAEAAWSACMAERGHDYAEYWDLGNSDEFGDGLPTAAEIAVAVDAAHCQHDSGRLWTVSSVQAELTHAALTQHPGLITEWLALQQRTVDALPGGAG